MSDDSLRYPIGKFQPPASVSTADIDAYIAIIEQLPAAMYMVVEGLNEQQLDTPYRDGGWTVRQVVHHVADSHMNAYIRFKLALTEDNPTIKPYLEADWAELPDSKSNPEISLSLLATLHRRWVIVLRAIKDDQWNRTFMHPEGNKQRDLKEVLALYAWHSEHHLGHITSLRKRKSW